MSRAFPYLRPPSDVVRPGPWIRELPQGPAQLDTAQTGWDYNTVLDLRRHVTVDGLRARSASGLPTSAVLALTVRWTASTSLLRGRAWRQPVPAEDGHELEIHFALPGAELGGVLDLDLVLTLVDDADAGSTITAHRPGSLLWSTTTSVDLDGDGIRFPIAVGDFADLLYPTDAAWHLEIGIDLHAAALGTILLVANEARPSVLDALRAARNADAEQAIVLAFLRADVLRGLVERAVTDQDFDPEHQYPTGSLGSVLAAVLARRLPAIDLASLRREHTDDPAMFSSRIQAASRLLASPR